MHTPLDTMLIRCPSSLSLSPFLTQEHPSLRGTPLAMLAAQCNKLSNKSPPPLADAAVGKGFHPWKKSPSSSSNACPQSPSPISSTALAASTANSTTGSSSSGHRTTTSNNMGSGQVTPR